jgi:hypothetical protein
MADGGSSQGRGPCDAGKRGETPCCRGGAGLGCRRDRAGPERHGQRQVLVEEGDEEERGARPGRWRGGRASLGDEHRGHRGHRRAPMRPERALPV